MRNRGVHDSAAAIGHSDTASVTPAAAGFVGIAPNVSAASPACKPTFEITNEKERAVKVLGLIYKDGDGKDWHEGLDNY